MFVCSDLDSSLLCVSEYAGMPCDRVCDAVMYWCDKTFTVSILLSVQQ